ncbi:MAG: 2-oxo acid dehydrogenase subunit E2 [Firmicutes bacterium]|nr:2-oxo acid dehydrogenase subunit E2 [Bacillota bacterium]
MSKAKRRWGDRRDATLIRDLDGLHFIMNIVYGKKTENEAYISQNIDLTAMNEYLTRLNYDGIDFKYTFFHIIVAAILKTVYLRPKLNRFIVNENMYQRNVVSAAFIVKKIFSDEGEEGLAFLEAHTDDTLESVHNRIKDIVTKERKHHEGSANPTEDAMNFFAQKLPRFLSKSCVHFLMWLDKHGWVPQALISDDPNQASVLISNLGSIKIKSGYHHLSNWGTTSMFCIVGEKEWRPIFSQDGSYVMHEFLDLGMTVDERLADGYYYSKSIKLLKYLLEHPEELEKPLEEEVSYE